MSAAAEDYEKGADKMIELARKHGVEASDKDLRNAFDMGAKWGVVCIINELERWGTPAAQVSILRQWAAAGVRAGSVAHD